MQHSSIPTPMTKPEQPAQKPVVVQEPPKPRNPAWFWLAGVAAFCAGAYWLYQKNLADEAIAAKRALTSATRTATVSGGKLLQTMRLTGTTGPEQFVTILGPQLRGSRSFGGGGGAFMG
ncbi:MAG: hypothetical protein JST93_36870, partial [Acidobacteria bacterium]|nr:hypothetical protein [Acidobacteriota bacterium]